MQDAQQDTNMKHMILSLSGGAAGLAMWLLIEELPDRWDNERLLMVLAMFTAAFFFGLFAASGPLRLATAAKIALGVATPMALLILWASYRFEDVDNFLESVHPFLAFCALTMVPLPFLITRAEGKSGRDYDSLFMHAWTIVVRYAAAWLFVGVFWLVVFLSDQLFQIIGLNIIEDLLNFDPVPYVLTGLALGFSISVVHELSDYISPFLITRLFRLLLPLVLVVAVVFLLGVPFRGLSGLFGSLSAATILMAMAIASATLVTVAIDRRDDDAVQNRMMRGMTGLLAVIIVIFAALAVYAVWVRVGQYGWSPQRLMAMTFALITVIYGTLYAVAVIMRRGWMERIRQANIVMAGIVIVTTVIWLTPMLNPQKISTNSQLARFESGLTTLEQFDFWEIGKEWGKAGQAVLPKLAVARPEQSDEIKRKLAALEDTRSRYDFNNKYENNMIGLTEELHEMLTVRPVGEAVSLEVLEKLSNKATWIVGCKRETPLGNPGCIALVADFLPEREGKEIFLVALMRPNRTVSWTWDKEKNWKLRGPSLFSRSYMTPKDIDLLFSGDFSIAAPP